MFFSLLIRNLYFCWMRLLRCCQCFWYVLFRNRNVSISRIILIVLNWTFCFSKMTTNFCDLYIQWLCACRLICTFVNVLKLWTQQTTSCLSLYNLSRLMSISLNKTLSIVLFEMRKLRKFCSMRLCEIWFVFLIYKYSKIFTLRKLLSKSQSCLLLILFTWTKRSCVTYLSKIQCVMCILISLIDKIL